jgi:hypothetical protein
MAFTTNIPDGFPSLYSDEWKLELQQLTSRLAPFVNVDVIHGEGKRYQRLPKVTARTIDTRFGDTNPEDISTEYRWLYVAFKDSAHILDRREQMQLGAVGSPHHQIMRLQLAAAGRDQDKVLIDGIRGTVQSGKTGGTPITLPAAQQIGAGFRYSGSGNTGLTFDKVLEAATRFGVGQVFGQDVDNESQGCLVITAREVQNLLLEEKLTSADYGIKRLMEGKVVNLFGLAVKVVDPAILPYDSATDIRTCVAFAREHVAFGMAENPQAFVDVLPTKKHDIQLRTEWGWGATRLDEAGVIDIAVDLSP